MDIHKIMLLYLFAVVFLNTQVCDDWIFTDVAICEDGNPVMESGCCEATNNCPDSCLHWGWHSINGQRTCSCEHCAMQTKISINTEERWLNAHNYYRCRHGQPLVSWNDEVENNAENLSSMCVYTHSVYTELGSTYEFEPSSGENIAMGFGTPEGTVTAWYSEITDPGYTPGTGFTEGIGHYTALIWESVSEIGCSRCESEKIDVCQYANSPPNYGFTSDYVMNVPQTHTPVYDEAYCCDQIYGSYAPILSEPEVSHSVVFNTSVPSDIVTEQGTIDTFTSNGIHHQSSDEIIVDESATQNNEDTFINERTDKSNGKSAFTIIVIVFAMLFVLIIASLIFYDRCRKAKPETHGHYIEFVASESQDTDATFVL